MKKLIQTAFFTALFITNASAQTPGTSTMSACGKKRQGWTIIKENTADRPISAYEAVKNFIPQKGGPSDFSTNPAHFKR